MNWHYLRTFLWLKWRLRVNQMRRAGAASLILQRVLLAVFILFTALAFAILLGVGLFGPPPPLLMLIWDGMVAGFVMFWLTELLVELQRSELLSLDRFLHLPVSLGGVFLINYIGSAMNPSVMVFLAGSVGFGIGLVITKGPYLLLLFPLIAAFTLAVTAVTYQFRGWLASLMVNKRRRRTIVTFATLGFVLAFQIPYFMGMARGWGGSDNSEPRAFREETRKLDRSRDSGAITPEEFERASDEIHKKYGIPKRDRSGRAEMEEFADKVTDINRIVPLGWLPLGARRLSEGSVAPALLGALGLVLIGGASLRRSYRTTVRLYTGQFTSKGRPAVAPTPAPAQPSAGKVTARPSAALMEKRLPWVSEHTSAVALAAFQSMIRAPETKLLLLSPIILMAVFGSMLFRQAQNPSEFISPLMASGAVAVILLTLTQLAGNQFGFDRSGFRTLVLAPASRRDILLGKNLALLPMAMGLGVIVILAVEILSPMRIDHLLAAIIQLVSMYGVFCLITNFLSILAPTPVASGSLKPVKPKGMTILLHLAFVFLFPFAMAPTLIPLGIEFLLQWSGSAVWFPAYLVLAAAELVAVAFLYPAVLRAQGRMLQSREQKILEVVTTRAE